MENKIALAKSIVSNHFTFYGGVMIAGNPTERNDIETMCTDGKNIGRVASRLDSNEFLLKVVIHVC